MDDRRSRHRSPNTEDWSEDISSPHSCHSSCGKQPPAPGVSSHASVYHRDSTVVIHRAVMEKLVSSQRHSNRASRVATSEAGAMISCNLNVCTTGSNGG
ncbi:hypothetical protein C0Q70_03958 [Pomacea canaliculata]|uniref:Uncharacterized protein n=1 Tax=Pomacea canaliculata TaxID=400727 RepID=A0A2T7PU63_POMCA|nr:hypothetical protein C0Q70_03958 [Pomacea canaliculata]